MHFFHKNKDMTTSIQQNTICWSSHLELKVMLNVQLESDWSKVMQPEIKFL